MFKRLRILLIILVLLAAGGYYGWGRLQETVESEPPQLVAVKKSLFVHEILERGSIDSARNVEVRCQVESAGGLTIISVVPEGTLVKAGDIVVELESSTLDENIQKQQIAVYTAEAALAQSKANLKTAQLTLTEFLEGTFLEQQETIKNELFTASELVKTQEDNLYYYKRLLERGYVTDTKVAADLIELAKAKNGERIANLKLHVLEKYTKDKTVTEYTANIESCLIKVKADEESYKLESDRLEHLKEQARLCQIKAPRDGQVVYYMPRWGGDEDLIKEGKKVFERQIILLLPDPTQMQVKGLINEANVRLVKAGQKAIIRLEAFPNQVFDGVVQSVNDFPEPTNFFGASMSKEYLATVTVLDPPEGIKTGLTAEARITVGEIPDALLLPMQAVFTYGGKTYAVTYKAGRWDKIEVKTGAANDKEVMITEGLKEGDEVVLGAWTHRDKINLPKLAEEPRQQSLTPNRPPSEQNQPGELDQPGDQNQLEEQNQPGEMGQPGGQPIEEKQVEEKQVGEKPVDEKQIEIKEEPKESPVVPTPVADPFPQPALPANLPTLSL